MAGTIRLTTDRAWLTPIEASIDAAVISIAGQNTPATLKATGNAAAVSVTGQALTPSLSVAGIWAGSDPVDLGTFAPGATYNLTQRLSDPADAALYTYSRTGSANDQAGATFTVNSSSGLLTIPSDATSGGYQIEVDASPLATQLTTLALTGGGAGKAWTFGHVFKQGDVPTGRYITATGPTNFQANVRNLWPDGSVKFAVLSGVAGTSAVLSATVGTAPTGSVAEPTTAASVQFSSPATTVQLATARTNGAMSWTKATAHKVREILGPVMSEFHYYSPVSGDSHLAVFWYVRAYVNGSVEVETVVENGWTMLASPAQKTYTATVTVNGTQRYSGSVSHYHHARWSRADWSGTDPAITPQHNGAYLRATKLVPNYGYTSPTAAAWSGNGGADTWGAPVNSENPAPLAQANFPAGMGDYGYDETIGLMPRLDALYITSQNVVAYRSVVGNARSWGRYSVHYRDESTGRPIKVSAPTGNASYATQLGLSSPATKYGVEDGAVDTPTATGSANTYTPTHSPAPAYLAYLITGRWSFMEHCQFLATFNWLCVPTSRQGASGVLVSNSGALTVRGVAWAWRTLAMATCVTPDSSTGLDGGLKAELVSMCSSNSTYYKNLYVGGSYDNGLNTVAQYDARPWMNDFLVAINGFVSDLQVLSGASQTTHNQWRDWNYQSIVGRFGTTTATYCWQDAAQYQFNFGPGGTLVPTSYYASWGALYLANNLGSSCSTSGDVHTTYGSKDCVTSYWGNLAPGLAYAVEHAASGAATAYGRLTGSASYQTEASATTGTYGGFHNMPMWGVVPR